MFLKTIHLSFLRLTAFMALGYFLQSCENEVKLDIPQEKKYKVLNCILYTDSLIKVYSSESQLITDTSRFKSRTCDTIIVFENGLAIDTLKHTTDGCYISKYKPQEGSIYTILAKNKILFSGKDTIPKISKIDTLRLTKVNNKNYYLRLVFKNHTNGNNYFYLRVLERDSSKISASNIYTLITTMAGINMSDNGFIFNNQQFKDSTISLDFSVNTAHPQKFVFEVQHISYSLYWYYLTFIYNYYANLGEGYKRTIMFNNIDNGVGIVGASAISRDSIDLK